MTLVNASGEPLGVVEWFRPGDEARIEAALERMARLGFIRLRTHLSWADFHVDDGRWYDWLLPALGAAVEVLPCVHFTPPSLSLTGTSAGPPRRPRDYADFIDEVISRYGRWFEWVELWNEPNNLSDWDWRIDPDWQIFSDMIGAAGHWARRRGRKTVLGGPCPTDLNWLRLMAERGVLAEMDAIGLHGFPGTWESTATSWRPWSEQVDSVRDLFRNYGLPAELWITEVGYSSWRQDPAPCLDWFVDAIGAPVDRLYWYMLQDIDPAVPILDGLQFDTRHYHFGLYDAQGRPKLAARLLEKGGITAVKHVAALGDPGRVRAPVVARRARPILITGGAGFIGCNLADSLAADGHDVLIFDSLHRFGVEDNLEWLRRRHPKRVSVAIADVRDGLAVDEAVGDAAAVFHFAAQVAVTTSMNAPDEDFEVNARGTLNVLEAARRRDHMPPIIFASTNKVYGDLSAHDFEIVGDQWCPVDLDLRAKGVSERQPLHLCTPYGCSKGTADQYVLDYAKSFGVPTAVLRMSCIYGPRQFGTEDQGWVAHFLMRARSGEAIAVFGDGRQVRDILHVSDAVAAYRLLLDNIAILKGRAFNLGGGPANAVSLLQVIAEIERVLGRDVPCHFDEMRPGDQRWYVSDTAAFAQATGWRSRIGWRNGLRDLDRALDAMEVAEPGRRRAGKAVA